jgi:hypothetical protein
MVTVSGVSAASYGAGGEPGDDNGQKFKKTTISAIQMY